MNKYQKALDFLRSEDVTAWGNDKIELLYFHLDILEELVEKATPKKPKKEFDDIICPHCNAKFNVCDNCTEMFMYCPNCGGKWSDEE